VREEAAWDSATRVVAVVRVRVMSVWRALAWVIHVSSWEEVGFLEEEEEEEEKEEVEESVDSEAFVGC
jgi:hypothetical protein